MTEHKRCISETTSMSKDPARSIPPGTLAAVFVTTLVFSGQVLMCGASVLRGTLLTDKVIVSRLAWPVGAVP